MDRSAYLAQALQSLGQAPQAASASPVDPQALAGVLKQRKAYETANPGGSYLGHNLMQAGRGAMAAPQNAMGLLGNVAGPAGALGGLFGLR